MNQVNRVAIILIGAPGSGKGTQGEILQKRTGFKKYIMSSLIKEAIKEGNKPWAKNYDMEDGTLLTDSDVFELFREKFKGEDEVILDGIPRTLDQSFWLYGFLTQHKYDIRVIYIKADEEKLLNRILLRAKKEGRKDDTKEIFNDRLKIFDKVKEVIVSVYNNSVIRINGDQEVDKVAKDIEEILGF